MIDWQLAQGTGNRLTRPGPELGESEVTEVVAELREDAAVASGPVREFTGLDASGAKAPVLVVDRPRWTQANLATFETLLDPLVAKLESSGRLGGPGRAVGAKVNGAQVGTLMAFMSGKVLGQFDPFWSGDAGDKQGRLLLVAPNIVQVEQQLKVDPRDFRLWVCLHEETHRVQFTAVPWMRDHLRSLMQEFVDATEVDAGALSKAFGDGVGEVVKIVRGESDKTLSDLFQNERQKDVVDRMTGIMSLLEGHADVVMDGVGPSVVPSVAEIRRKFSQRRKGSGPLDRVIRRLLGLDAKMRQYRDGAAFVRSVTDKVGREGFDAVWASPVNLPGRAEILDPDAWVARVHG